MVSQRVKLVEGGKLVIPAAFRREMNFKPGDTLIVEVDRGELRVRSLFSAIQRVLARTRGLQRPQRKEEFNDALTLFTSARAGLAVLTAKRDEFDPLQQLAPEGRFVH